MPDLKTAYEQAIQNEIMSQNLYAALARSFSRNPEVAQTFSRLIPMESVHEDKLRALHNEKFPGETIKIDSALCYKLSAPEIAEPVKVLEFAISREEAAHNIYTQLAAESAEPALKQLFSELAAEEANHKTVLQTEILRLDGLMTWYDPSELNGFMDF